MSKARIIFSKKDPLGSDSTLDQTLRFHAIKFETLEWKIDKYYPRGKAYWKLFNLQLEKEERGYDYD